MPSANDEEDPYAHVAKGPLKLKNDQCVSKKYVYKFMLKFYFRFRLSQVILNLTDDV